MGYLSFFNFNGDINTNMYINKLKLYKFPFKEIFVVFIGFGDIINGGVFNIRFVIILYIV